jgi:hypothetical protein
MNLQFKVNSAKDYFRKPNHTAILLSIFFLMAVALRSLSINKELSDLLFCDEEIYQGELKRIIDQDSYNTKVFSSGGLNFILFIPIFKFILLFQSSISNDQILLITRFLFPVILSSLTVFIIYLLGQLVTKNKKIPILSSFFYAIAAYPVSQSHIFYPDSYSVFFGTLIMYSIIKYLTFEKSRITFMALTISLGLSIKYTFICFIFSAILAISIKSFTNRVGVVGVLTRTLNFVFLVITFVTILNYSILFHPFNFFFDFAANFANYGRSVESSIPTGIFYILSIILIPVGLSGIILFTLSFYLSIKQKSITLIRLVFLSPLFIFLLIMSTGNLATVRNTNLLLFIPFIVFSYGIVKLSEIKSFFGRFLIILIIFSILSQSFYLVLQTLRQDAREQATEWINNNIPKSEIIGTNPGCGYKLLANEEYKLIYDQKMENNYNYYIFDMNWANTNFYSEYAKNSWYLEFNPSYIAFYHGHNMLPSSAFNFNGFGRSFEKYIPKGYDLRIFSGYGPDVIILKKKSEINF